MRLYCITADLETVRRAFSENPLTTIQIRAKHLGGRELAALTSQAVAIAGRNVVVNTRVDVALACGAGGVHLPAGSIAPSRIRTLASPGFQIGVSCHTVLELQRAQDEGADFAVYGPVFATGGKTAIGIDALAAAVRSVSLAVYALGGITLRQRPSLPAGRSRRNRRYLAIRRAPAGTAIAPDQAPSSGRYTGRSTRSSWPDCAGRP